MARYLDLATWSRRDLFEFFRGYDNPFFSVCVRLDVTRLLSALRDRPDISISLTYHYFALRIANQIEPFRYRLRGDSVLVHDVINGGTTVLLPDESFSFAYFDHSEDFETFIRAAQKSVEFVRSGKAGFKPQTNDDKIHFTTLPWLSFTSFSNARNWGPGDSIPKIAFGKFTEEGGRTLLPISVEVHHALMDGLHVGRYLSQFDAALGEPEKYLN